MTIWLRVLGWLRRIKLPLSVADVCVLVGVAALFYGCHQIWPPLAWVVLGVLLGGFGALLVYLEKTRKRSP